MTERKRHLLPILLVIMTMSSGAAGCGEQRPRNVTGSAPAGGWTVNPGSFLGVLPCADCQGLRYRLDLFEDGVFFLRVSYLGMTESREYDDIGRWSISSSEPTLNLAGSSETPLFFHIVSDNVLRKLDLEGDEIHSDLNYELFRGSDLAVIEPHLLLSGMYRYFADAASFVECRTGRRLAVAFEADNITLESAYLEARESAEEEILTVVEGRIARRPAMEGDGTRPSLVVDRFIGIRPGESCDLQSTTQGSGSTIHHADGRRP